MHHFIFCQKDTFIYSEETAREKNFGLTPYIEVGSVNKLSRTFRTASFASTAISNELVSRYVRNFTGTFTGSISCATGSVSGSVNCSTYGITCQPLGVVDEFGNILTEDDGDPLYLLSDEDFSVFP